MNNVTGAFSIYEVLRILLPGFYITLMLKRIFQHFYDKNSVLLDLVDGWIIFLIVSVILGGFIYSLDIPRWFKKLYKTLPSNLIEKNKDIVKPESESKRFYENEYFKFYYAASPDIKLKTEIQSGFFHYLISMAFISLVFSLVFSFFCSEYYDLYFNRILNVIVFLISLISAIVMYKRKLRHSWKRNYESFVESLEGNNTKK